MHTCTLSDGAGVEPGLVASGVWTGSGHGGEQMEWRQGYRSVVLLYIHTACTVEYRWTEPVRWGRQGGTAPFSLSFSYSFSFSGKPDGNASHDAGSQGKKARSEKREKRDSTPEAETFVDVGLGCRRGKPRTEKEAGSSVGRTSTSAV